MSKGFGNIMKMAQKAQAEILKLQEELADREVETTVGGGMVIVKANGRQEIVSIAIAKEAVNPDDVEMLQDLVLTAVNAALKKAQAMITEEMTKITGGMNIPGLF